MIILKSRFGIDIQGGFFNVQRVCTNIRFCDIMAIKARGKVK